MIKWLIIFLVLTSNLFTQEFTFKNGDTTIFKNPLEIGSCNLWLRADLDVTETAGRVSQWDDQSISGSNFTQSTSGYRPVKSNNVYNNKPAIFFNPVFASAGEHISFNDQSAIYKMTDAVDVSIMITLMSDGTNFDYNSGYFCPIARSNTSYGSQFALLRGVNTGPVGNVLSMPFPNGTIQALIPIVLNIPHQIIITGDNGVYNVYLDGQLIQTITRTFTTFATETNSYFVLGQYYNGAGYTSGRYTGYIFETAFWTKTLTSTDVKRLYVYHKNYFNIN